MEPQGCFILATNELDTTQLPAQALLEGYKGQVHAARGVRFLKDPCFPASSLSRKKPERIMALFMVMTVCAGICGVGVSHSPSAQGPRDRLSQPQGPTGAEPDRTVGLP